MAARKPKAVAPVAPKRAILSGLLYRADTYHEIPNGDGVMRVEAGDYVVSVDDVVSVYPPERFAEAFPDLVDL